MVNSTRMGVLRIRSGYTCKEAEKMFAEWQVEDAYRHGYECGVCVGTIGVAAFLAYLFVPWPVVNILAAAALMYAGWRVTEWSKDHFRDRWPTP